MLTKFKYRTKEGAYGEMTLTDDFMLKGIMRQKKLAKQIQSVCIENESEEELCKRILDHLETVIEHPDSIRQKAIDAMNAGEAKRAVRYADDRRKQINIINLWRGLAGVELFKSLGRE